jgi:signal transduction histidine kinase
MRDLLGADLARIARFEPDGTATILADTSGLGAAREPEQAVTEVYRTGRHARVDDAVASPVTVGGRRWGAIIVSSASRPLPPRTEERVGEFTELLAIAIANAEDRAQLIASRARIVSASDETRRKLERDLHDGVQQRLVSLALILRAAEEDLPPELPELRATLSRTVEGLNEATEELRELSQGIHPAILSEGGLGPALKALARRSAVPVELSIRSNDRLPEHVEVTAYYAVAEALANATKHASASVVSVDVERDDAVVRVRVHDDGVGGADPSRGSGLVGLADRVGNGDGARDHAHLAGAELARRMLAAGAADLLRAAEAMAA